MTLSVGIAALGSDSGPISINGNYVDLLIFASSQRDSFLSKSVTDPQFVMLDSKQSGEEIEFSISEPYVRLIQEKDVDMPLLSAALATEGIQETYDVTGIHQRVLSSTVIPRIVSVAVFTDASSGACYGFDLTYIYIKLEDESDSESESES